MANIKLLRSRIKAAKNTQQITKAMKLVAAARLKKATDRVLEARPYATKLKELMASLSAAGDLPAHPLLEKRDSINRIALILCTSDRGLAGAYNTNLLKKGQEFIRDAGAEVVLLTLGKKGQLFFGKRGTKVEQHWPMPAAGATLQEAREMTAKAQAMFESGEVDAVYVIYSKFYSPVRQTPVAVQLLPIQPEDSSDAATDTDFEFTPNAEAILGTLLPRYFQTLVWQAMLEATASEFGSRMTAMTNATDNAGKMIASLTLKANRERQASITKEILEVVGGAEALNG